MFAIEVKRTNLGPEATEGQLSINGQPECVTLEPVVREVPGQPVSEWKIDGKTAIPAGTYDVVITFSPKFGRLMPLLVNVPGFEAVRIHPGNTDADTEGCILVGSSIVNGDFIGSSQVAFAAFFEKLRQALANGEHPTVTVGQ